MPSRQGTIIKDIMDAARWQEADGRITQIDRKVLIHDFEVPPNGHVADAVCNKALQSTLMPQPGVAHPHQGDLLLRGRVARAVSTNIVEVLLTYKLPAEGSLPDPMNYELSGGASIQQVQTEVVPPGRPEPSGQVTVEYNGVVQGGEISPYEAIATVRFEYIAATQIPLSIVRSYTNLVNDGTFWGFDPSAMPRTWIISEVSFERVALEPVTQYRFGFQLQHNPDGWDPQVIYVDPETGRPPADLVANLGYKTIAWHNAVNFGAVLP
jgi:hypothetical protein